MAVIRYNDCRPQVVLNLSPCIKCASESDLWRLLLYLIAYIMNEDGDIQEVLEEAKCWTCVSDKQKLEGLIVTIASNYQAINVATVLTQVQCLRCRPDAEIKAGLVYLLCRFFDIYAAPA